MKMIMAERVIVSANDCDCGNESESEFGVNFVLYV